MPAVSATKRHPLLPPVGNSGLVDSVSRRLTEAIRMGLLSPGEQLPPESTLSAQLEVSSVTLREALSRLRTQGLIETRRGRNGGSFVCEPTATSDAILRVQLGDFSVSDLRDLADEYLAIASISAQLAAMRADEEDIAKIRSHVARLKEPDLDLRASAQTLSRFNIEISLATLSERLTRNQVRLQSEIGELVWFADRDGGKTIRQECAALADAVAEEDAKRARSLAADHVTRVTRSLVECLLAGDADQ